MTVEFINKIKKSDVPKIEKALEHGGFGDCDVDLDYNSLKVPDLYKGELSIIAIVLAEAGDYRLDVYHDDIVIDDD